MEEMEPTHKKVYPRVGGGTHMWASFIVSIHGLSPRGRGNRPVLLGHGVRGRSIPAWTGEPLIVSQR